MSDDTKRDGEPQKSAKIYTEQAKQQHVTHWDRDYLPREQIAGEQARAECPKCQAAVEPGQPACAACGERLFVEHPGEFRRDGKATEAERFRQDG